MSFIQDLWTREPARVIAVLVAVVVFALAKAGVVVDEQNVGEALALILPVLLGGEAIRSQVAPAEPDFTSDDLAGAVRASAHDHTGLGEHA